MVDAGAARSPALPPAHGGAVIAVIAIGGVVGALARYQLGRWWPTPADGFPAATLVVNLLGCLAIGVLLVLITERFQPHPLLRPFVATGVLGGFTTFSTYALDVAQLLEHGRVDTALLYLVVTALGAVCAAGIGMAGTRRVLARGR
jgi:CrcB protein